MDTPVQLTPAASEEQAQIIQTIGLLATGLDLPYCRTAAKAMIDQAGRQKALAVLNPSHRQTNYRSRLPVDPVKSTPTTTGSTSRSSCGSRCSLRYARNGSSNWSGYPSGSFVGINVSNFLTKKNQLIHLLVIIVWPDEPQRTIRS